MIIFQFHHYIKSEFVDSYKEAVLEDARESVKEIGIIRFEVFQDQENPSHFILLEYYRDMQAREFHMQTPYLAKFKETLSKQVMFSRPAETVYWERLFPDDHV
jgi:autoinducer 2-degrading protein